MTSQSKRLTTENDPRWAAVVARDPQADGQFVYAVKTTGIYCNPSSLARLPKPQNVEFFDTAELAQAAGYRPSKRAAKDQSDIATQHAATVAAACRQIESAEAFPAFSELADARRPQQLSFPSGIQGRHWSDSQRLRRCPSLTSSA
jgi:AraC family transcriptional regulator of adaptative response/methylated-DNA-[protein]-cysteine methyltransferase